MQYLIHFVIQSHFLVIYHTQPPHPSPHYAQPSYHSYILIPSYEKLHPTPVKINTFTH
jgi:hypothetical protein